MASIETVDFGATGKLQQTNLSWIVGAGQKNDRNDVLLIQTLFKLIGFIEEDVNTMFGLSANDLPELTGNFDAKTLRAIWAYQRKRKTRLRNIDGKIHPASYKNRVLRKGMSAPQMMITLLNIDASYGANFISTDVVSAVKALSPSIVFAPPPPKTP